MGVFRVRIISQDKEVIDKFKSHFVEQVNSKSMGSVRASARQVREDYLILTLDYKALGLWAFRKVVFPEIKKTAQKKDKNAKVELIKERKRKTSLKERIFGRFRKAKAKGTKAKG
ncbi:MAG: hypothetical protein AM326_08230 [Candidatus Thorarchaeota archaeon SMTZ-45]|nr:MAG: hypothetical protein AM326_08230 [Candidatus Thorarchaeota archaeon SMTZ-45]